MSIMRLFTKLLDVAFRLRYKLHAANVKIDQQRIALQQAQHALRLSFMYVTDDAIKTRFEALQAVTEALE